MVLVELTEILNSSLNGNYYHFPVYVCTGVKSLDEIPVSEAILFYPGRNLIVEKVMCAGQ